MRSAHPYYMYDHGIQAQPDSVSRVFLEETSKVAQLADKVSTSGVERIHLVGMGTSYHAALVAQQWIQQICQMSYVFAWQSFEVCCSVFKAFNILQNFVSPVLTNFLRTCHSVCIE